MDGVETYISEKALAEVLGVSVKTVSNAAKKKGVESTFHPLETDGGTQNVKCYSEQQATLIKQEVQKHHNLATRKVDSVTTELEENQKVLEAMAILQNRNVTLKARIESLESENEKLRPAAAFAYQLCGAKNAIDMGECAKCLDMKIGRNRLFQFLRDEKILQGNNQPYQKYIDMGYFRCVESLYVTPRGETKVSVKTVVFQKGLAFINRKLREAAERGEIKDM